MKYIDAERLREELENSIRCYYDFGISTPSEGGELNAYEDILAFIDFLQQEQPEEDEDFFFDEVLKVYDDNNKYPPRSEEELTMLETIARHFYELGLNARKEDKK